MFIFSTSLDFFVRATPSWMLAQAMTMPCGWDPFDCKRPAVCRIENVHEFLNSFSIHGAFCSSDFAILNCWLTQTRDPNSQAPTENDSDDLDQHHIRAPWKRVSRKGHEKRRGGQFGKNCRPGTNRYSSTNLRLYLVGNCLLAGIFYCAHVVADVGGLQLRAACHLPVLSLHLHPELPSSGRDHFPVTMAWCHGDLSWRFSRGSDLT